MVIKNGFIWGYTIGLCGDKQLGYVGINNRIFLTRVRIVIMAAQ